LFQQVQVNTERTSSSEIRFMSNGNSYQ